MSELETQVIISQRLGYMEENHNIEEKIDKVFRPLAGLVKAIKKNRV